MGNHVSRLIKAVKGFKEELTPFSAPPQGSFKRVAVIESAGVTLKSEELDFEFTVSFDDDAEANEAEIIVYNLSKTTVKALKYNNSITITAGYNTDTGVIFKGYISKVRTKKVGNDKVTTINALDDVDLKERNITEITFKAGTKASYILKTLIKKLSLPLAVFKVRRDFTYKDDEKVDGGLMDNIRKYASVCGISVYINKGQIYARHISEGDNTNFIVKAETGLIGSPEEFEEEVSAEKYKDVIKGYSFEMLLQHRMTTGAIINLSSQNVSGKYRVRSGKHTFSPDEAITSVEVV